MRWGGSRLYLWEANHLRMWDKVPRWFCHFRAGVLVLFGPQDENSVVDPDIHLVVPQVPKVCSVVIHAARQSSRLSKDSEVSAPHVRSDKAR